MTEEDVSPEEEEVRTSRRPLVALVVAVLALAGALAWALGGTGGTPSPVLPEGVPIIHAPDLAPATTTASGGVVDGIHCVTESEQKIVLHTHTLVLIYVNGVQMRLPAGLGITAPWIDEHFSGGDFFDVGPSDCLYWLHVHADDGIVHVEAPMRGTFTLGELFAIWRQPLSASQVGPATGPVTAFVNGTAVTGDPASIRLTNLATIQLDVGTPVVPGRSVTFHVRGSCGAGASSCSAS